jgi:osmoprotectant transport system substrate-binding protein
MGQGWGLSFRLLIVILAAGVTACATQPSTPSDTPRGSIVVGSYSFVESRVLGAVYTRLLDAHGFPATQIRNVAAREILEPALEQGKVDFVPEYQGATLRFVSLRGSLHPTSAVKTHRLLAHALKPHGVGALAYSPGQDRNEFVVSRQTAHRYHLRTISDLGPVANRLIFGGPPECLARPFCLEGLRRVYGIHFRSFVPLDAGGPLSLAALEGKEVDVALLFTTDPAIVEHHLVVLKDDRHLQPADNIVPVVRRSVLARFGHGLSRVIDRTTRLLTKDTLRRLNRKVSVGGAAPADVAHSWLRARGMTP